MNEPRRLLLHRLALGGAALAAAPASWAQPARKLTMLVGFPPGGGPDLVARAVAEPMRAAGYTVVVENRPGATGRLAGEALLASPPDGATTMIVPGGNLTIHPHIYPKLKYAPLRDFVPLATACEFPFALAVGPSVPARTLGEFIAWAKAHPGKAAFGTPGNGTGMHFLGVTLAREARIDLQHVPYTNGLLPDMLGGNIASGILIVPILNKMHTSGRLRILAVSGEARAASLPDVPTFKEAGFPSLALTESFLFVARAQTPAAVQKDLSQALDAAVNAKTVKDTLAAADFDVLTLPQEAIGARLRRESARWGEIVKATGYTSED